MQNNPPKPSDPNFKWPPWKKFSFFFHFPNGNRQLTSRAVQNQWVFLFFEFISSWKNQGKSHDFRKKSMQKNPPRILIFFQHEKMLKNKKRHRFWIGLEMSDRLPLSFWKKIENFFFLGGQQFQGEVFFRGKYSVFKGNMSDTPGLVGWFRIELFVKTIKTPRFWNVRIEICPKPLRKWKNIENSFF